MKVDGFLWWMLRGGNPFVHWGHYASMKIKKMEQAADGMTKVVCLFKKESLWESCSEGSICYVPRRWDCELDRFF